MSHSKAMLSHCHVSRLEFRLLPTEMTQRTLGPGPRVQLNMNVVSIRAGKAVDLPEESPDGIWGKPWRTAFQKSECIGQQWLGYEGIRGDEQADRRFHGGVDKAVCVYPLEHYPYWIQQLGLPQLGPGDFGENFTTGGALEEAVCIGDMFSLGSATVQVSQPRQPCWKLARRWHVRDLAAQVEQTGRTGFYFRVLHHGWVESGQELRLIDRPFPTITIALANRVMHQQRDDADAAKSLAGCSALSGSWKDALWRRVG